MPAIWVVTGPRTLNFDNVNEFRTEKTGDNQWCLLATLKDGKQVPLTNSAECRELCEDARKALETDILNGKTLHRMAIW